MRKGWKYRLFCGSLALAVAAAEPAVIYAEEGLKTETQETLPEGGAGENPERSQPEGDAGENPEGNQPEGGAGENPEGSQPEGDAGENPEGSQPEGGARENPEGSQPVGDAGGNEGNSREDSPEDGLSEDIDGQEQQEPTMDEQIDAYFEGSAFVGDSVMQGYGSYAMRRGGPCLGRMQFLAAVSFSVFNALRPVTAKSTHPIYQGQKRYVWESLGMMQAKKVFLFFGLNDIDMGPLESTCARYAQVIANIKANCPEAEIHIISMTYIRPGKAKGRLNNPTIRQFNGMLQQMALENGWGYVEVANHLADANGDLAAVYCSDNYCHLKTSAYDVWTAVLREYAQSQIEGTSPFPAGGPRVPEEEETEASDDEAAEEEQDTEEPETSRVIGPKEEESLAGPGVVE